MQNDSSRWLFKNIFWKYIKKIKVNIYNIQWWTVVQSIMINVMNVNGKTTQQKEYKASEWYR